MRIYSNAYELVSETGRNLWEMGSEVKPKTYQNQNIEGNEDFITKELICEQYCLTSLPDPDILFTYTNSKGWAEQEFKERISGKQINPGEAYKLRADLWEQFLVENKYNESTYIRFDYTYPERMNQEVNYKGEVKTKIEAIIQLLSEDPDTRKAILDIYGHSHVKVGENPALILTSADAGLLDGSQRIPCSMYYDFLIRENASGDKQLNICYHQRSSDFVTHFGNDVYLAWKLMQYIAGRLSIKEGYLYHTIDSLHVYKKDWDTLKNSLNDN